MCKRSVVSIRVSSRSDTQVQYKLVCNCIDGSRSCVLTGKKEGFGKRTQGAGPFREFPTSGLWVTTIEEVGLFSSSRKNNGGWLFCGQWCRFGSEVLKFMKLKVKCC